MSEVARVERSRWLRSSGQIIDPTKDLVDEWLKTFDPYELAALHNATVARAGELFAEVRA